jgi:hypothetical protein
MKPFEYLFLRNIRFDYICPPICEAFFSSTGEPTILLEVFDTNPVVGLEYEWDGSQFRIKWSAYPGALCYSVYQVESGQYVLVAECVEEIVVPDDGECYVVTAITPEGETAPSGVICPTTATCPTWASVPPDQDVPCGDDLVLTAEATNVNPPGVVIKYEWILNDNLVFSETKTGASTYTAENVDEDTDGVLLIQATYGSCQIQSEVVLNVVGCGGGLPTCDDDPGPMPASFLVDDGTLIGSFVGSMDGPQPVLGTLPGGVYRLDYVGGSTSVCQKLVSPFYGCDAANRIYSSRGMGAFFTSDGGATTWAGLGGGVTAGELGVAPPPNECENMPSVAAAVASMTNFHGGGPNVQTDTTATLAHSYTGYANCELNVSTHAEENPGGECEATNDQEFSLTRTKRWSDHPLSLQISGWATLWALIKPAVTIDHYGWPAKAWSGFSQAPGIAELDVTYSLFPVASPIVEFVDLQWGWLRGIAGDRWTIELWGWWVDGPLPAGEHDEILWKGEKLGGNDGRGAYSRVSAWNDGTPTCVTVV